MKRIRRYMANKAEDFLRNATGMPPRPGSREAKKNAASDNKNAGYNNGGSYYRTRRNHRQPEPPEPIIPKEYAEDVDFVETKEFSSSTINPSSKEYSRTDYHESQVSDAEWVEIKNKK